MQRKYQAGRPLLCTYFVTWNCPLKGDSHVISVMSLSAQRRFSALFASEDVQVTVFLGQILTSSSEMTLHTATFSNVHELPALGLSQWSHMTNKTDYTSSTSSLTSRFHSKCGRCNQAGVRHSCEQAERSVRHVSSTDVCSLDAVSVTLNAYVTHTIDYLPIHGCCQLTVFISAPGEISIQVTDRCWPWSSLGPGALPWRQNLGIFYVYSNSND